MQPQRVFLCVVAAVLVWEAVKQWLRVLRAGDSDSWPSVEGTILRSEPFAKHSRAGVKNRGHIYIPLIHYTYKVRGREYEGDVITYGNEPLYTSWPDRAQRKCNEFLAGSPASVYYDPEDPGVACLERGGQRSYLGYGWSILFALAAIGLVAGFVVR